MRKNYPLTVIEKEGGFRIGNPNSQGFEEAGSIEDLAAYYNGDEIGLLNLIEKPRE